MTSDLSEMRWPSGAVLLLAATVLASCQPVDFVDARSWQRTFAELIEEAPIVVVATVGERKALPRQGRMARPNMPPAPAHEINFSLNVQYVLRGSLSAGQKIHVVSYESDLGVTGAPVGTSGAPGSRGIYFLQQSPTGFRTIVDEFEMWVPVLFQPDPSDFVAEDLPLTIWNLVVGPFVRGELPADRLDWGNASQYSGWLLGRARMIELLKSQAQGSPFADVRLSACQFLNRVHAGCGGEQCLSHFLARGSLDANTRTELERQLGAVCRRNVVLLEDLRGGGQRDIEIWARSSDPAEIARFLRVLESHPDSRIAALAKKRRLRAVQNRGRRRNQP